MAWKIGGSILGRCKEFFCFLISLGPKESLPTYFRDKATRSMKLIIRLHLEYRLRMSGLILLLPQYAVMTCTGVTLPLKICLLFVYGYQSLQCHMQQTVAVSYC